MARWEALQKAKYASESRSLDRDISSAEDTETKKSAYSGLFGMAGAVGLPLAFSAMTGGASMALPTLMAAVGIGSFGGRAIGSALGGESKDIGSGTFLKSRRSEAQSLIDQAGTKRRKDILWGAVKDAGTAGFVKAGGLDAFKEIGAKSLTKLVGEEAASNLYKASGMMAEGDTFSDILEGTKARDMWTELGEINPLQIRKNLIGKRDLKAAKESLISAGTYDGSLEKMKARTAAGKDDPSMFGMDDFEKQTYQDSLKRSNALGDKNLKLTEEINKQLREKGLKDNPWINETDEEFWSEVPPLRTKKSSIPTNIIDAIDSHIKSGQNIPPRINLQSPIKKAQNTLNQKVSMYNQATGGAVSSSPVSGLSPRGQAFKDARERGDKSFWFEGMEYNTRLAEELG